MSSKLGRKIRRWFGKGKAAKVAPPSAEAQFGRVSFAQEGEDLLLWRILEVSPPANGTYVEVGSNHPWKCSNTAFFSRRGWSGVAIDPNPDFVADFARERPADVFLNVGIGDREGVLLYHRFEESLYNTFVAEKAAEVAARGVRSLGAPMEVPVLRLADALGRVWPEGRRIDLLSIDAEGMDEAIVRTHDFARFPAAYIIVEFDTAVFLPGAEPVIVGMLRERGYVFVSKLYKSGLFIREDEARRLRLI